jgi:hypothetical protein
MAALYKFGLLVSASAAFLLFILFAAAPLISNAKLVLFSSSQVPYANQIKASKQNVWADLSPNEAGQVIAFLHSKSDLNLAKAPKAARSVVFKTIINFSPDQKLARTTL